MKLTLSITKGNNLSLNLSYKWKKCIAKVASFLNHISNANAYAVHNQRHFLIKSPIALNSAMIKSREVFIVSEEDDIDASSLTKKHCVPCEVGTKLFDLETVNNVLPIMSKSKLEDQEG